MEVGFTGTQLGMTKAQYNQVWVRLHELPWKVFRHGNCIGADEEAAGIAMMLLGDDKERRVIAHPGNTPAKQSTAGYYTEILPPMANLVRNCVIVDNVDELIAAPHTRMEYIRSGTWATIRYAKKRGISLEVFVP